MLLSTDSQLMLVGHVVGHRDVKLRINVLDMSISSPHWHTIFCDRIYEGDSRYVRSTGDGAPLSVPAGLLMMLQRGLTL